MEGAARFPTARSGRGHDVGLGLLVILAAGLVFTLEFMSWTMVEAPVPMDANSWLVLVLSALPLLLSLLAIGISLVRRPLWAKWSAAILILLVPQILMFGVLNG